MKSRTLWKWLAFVAVMALCLVLVTISALAMMRESDFGTWLGGDSSCSHPSEKVKTLGDFPDDGNNPGTHINVLECTCGAQFCTRQTCADNDDDGKCDKCNVEMPSNSSQECTHPKDKLIRQSCLPKDDNTHVTTYTCGVCEKEVTEEEPHDFQTFPASEGDPNFPAGTLVDYCGKCNHMKKHESSECPHDGGTTMVNDGLLGHHEECNICHENIYGVSLAHETEQGKAFFRTPTDYGCYEACTKCSYSAWVTLPLPKDLNKAEVGEIPDQEYNGGPVTPDVTVILDGENLTGSQDYTVEYENNDGPGTGVVIIKPVDGVSTGEIRKEFVITAPDCNHRHAKKLSINMAQHQLYCPDCKQYLGEPESHNIQTTETTEGHYQIITDTCSECNYHDRREMCRHDGEVTYVNDASTDKYMKGTHHIECNICHTDISGPLPHQIVEGKAFYRNELEYGRYETCSQCGYSAWVTLPRPKKLSDAKIADIPDQKYDGKPVTPEENVTLYGRELIKGQDYTVEYENNDKPGTGVIIIKPLDGVSIGEKRKEFKISGDCTHPNAKLESLGASMHQMYCPDCKQYIGEMEPHDLVTTVTISDHYRVTTDTCSKCPFASMISSECIHDAGVTYTSYGMQGHKAVCEICKQEIGEILAHDIVEGKPGQISESHYGRTDTCSKCDWSEWVPLAKPDDASPEPTTAPTEQVVVVETPGPTTEPTPVAVTPDPTPYNATCAEVGHNWSKWDKLDEEHCIRVCVRCGAEETPNHEFGDWIYAGAKHSKICHHCVYVVELDHDWENITIRRENTCNQPASVEAYCPTCKYTSYDMPMSELQKLVEAGKAEADKVLPLGHDFENGKWWNYGPTLVTDPGQGTHCKLCARCGVPDSANKTGHHFGTIPVVQAGECENPSQPRIEEAYCVDCGAHLRRVTELHHNQVRYPEGDIEPTCTEFGKEAYQCTICKQVFGDAIQPLGHDIEIVEKVDATCETEGFIHRKCTRGDLDETEILKTLSPDGKHHFEPVASLEPTCTKDGQYNGEKCIYCPATQDGKTGYDTIPALGHKVVSSTASHGRTRTAVGKDGRPIEMQVYVTTFSCKRCGASLGGEIFTVATSVGKMGGQYLIESGNVTITDMENGIHVNGNMQRDGGVRFRDEVQKGFDEVIKNAGTKYTYKKTETKSFVIEFTDEFLAEIEDGEYELVVINGSEYWPMMVTVQDHKFKALRDVDVPDMPELTEEEFNALLSELSADGTEITSRFMLVQPGIEAGAPNENGDIVVTKKDGDYGFASIVNGEYTLAPDQDYILEGDTITLKAEYLNGLTGETEIVFQYAPFDMDGAPAPHNPILTIGK
ncbi:MAG: hypothetical protein IKN04_11955 [Clostridia bacterium]|nr:hypothetical protein [Clostridia bacterium]